VPLSRLQAGRESSPHEREAICVGASTPAHRYLPGGLTAPGCRQGSISPAGIRLRINRANRGIDPPQRVIPLRPRSSARCWDAACGGARVSRLRVRAVSVLGGISVVCVSEGGLEHGNR
jgi:hypothetical protein